MATINELLIEATAIRNETNPGANTAARIGNLFIGIVETLRDQTLGFPPALQSTGYLTNYPFSIASANIGMAEEIVYYMPVFNPTEQPFSFIQMQVVVGSTGVAQMGLYDSVAGVPVNLIADTVGSINVGTSGIKQVEFNDPVILPAGWYFIAYTAAVATPTVRGRTDGLGSYQAVQYSNVLEASPCFTQSPDIIGQLPAVASVSLLSGDLNTPAVRLLS